MWKGKGYYGLYLSLCLKGMWRVYNRTRSVVGHQDCVHNVSLDALAVYEEHEELVFEDV